jgi:hypothetical protein
MITSILTFMQNVQAEFVAAFDDALIPGGIRWPNARFIVPDVTSGDLWITHDIILGESTQIDTAVLAGSTFRTIGIVQVVIYAMPENGDKSSLELADLIANYYRTADIAGAQFRSPSIEIGGLSGGWWTTRIRCPFYADRVA